MGCVTYAAGVTTPHHSFAPSTPPRAAAVVCFVEAVLLLVTAGMYGMELAAGEAFDASTASMSLVVSLIFAILLAVLGMSWAKGSQWPRTPTIVWNALLLPAAWTLGTSTGLWFGLGLGALALVGIAAAVLSPAHFDDRAL